jgi:hypothetical protein
MKTSSPRARKANGGAPDSAREVFIVRVWRQARHQPNWLAQVQHVRTGQIKNVRGARELLAYFRHQIDSDAPKAPRGLK